MNRFSGNLLGLGLLIASAPAAYAYGDPAASGFVIQAVLAGGFAGLALLRGQAAKLFGMLLGKTKRAHKQSAR